MSAPTGATPLVNIQGVSKSFRRKSERIQVLQEIDLQVAHGELLVLLGPSGCGKTTLLRCLAGLERPDSGRIQLRDVEVVNSEAGVFKSPNKRDVGMVFQNYALWPHMKVAKNVAYPLRSRGMKDAINEGRVADMLDLVQCSHLADRYPPELSGGQQQRVSLARALASRPSLLLLDEPLSNLDALLRIELRAQLRVLHRQLDFTGIYVTHDQEEAIALGSRVAVMNAGRVEQLGAPSDVYDNPATEYVADFLGARNRLAVTFGASGEVVVAGQVVPGMAAAAAAGDYHFRVRDRHLHLRPQGSDSPSTAVRWLSGATLVEVVPGTETSEYVVEFAGQTLFAAAPSGTSLARPGDAIDLGIDPRRTLCYDEDTNLVQNWSREQSATAAVDFREADAR